MAYLDLQKLAGQVWRLARAQHGVIALFQLLELGYTMSAVKHRVAAGRLHPVRRGVYAVGRPQLTRKGEWMAAVLSCGDGCVLSHLTAAALWRVTQETGRAIHVQYPTVGFGFRPTSSLTGPRLSMRMQHAALGSP